MTRALTALIGVVAGLSLALPGAAGAAPADSADTVRDPSQAVTASTRMVRVVVTLDNQPATASAGTEAANLSRQDALLADWSQRFDLQVRRQFGYLVNGFSAQIPEDKIPVLAAEPGVATVQRAREYVPTDDSSAQLVQATQARQDYGVDGSGLVVAIIDTGIDVGHQDMRLDADAADDAKIQDVASGFTLKVPYGHNFADENDTVLDTTGSEHGMHVAGIVAANGGSKDASPTTTGTINGIAPNAQLLAMKVFSNAPEKAGSAYDDDIIAAIEDSVKHGADIINMSLGSPSGFSGDDYGIQKAVRTATDAGTFVVISAGNSGLRGSPTGDTDDLYGYQDSATVGGPSTTPDALSVASIENSVVTSQKGSAFWSGSDTPDLSFPYSHQAGELVTTPTRLVSGGFGGSPDDFPVDTEGAIALVQRGNGVNFADKIANAFAAGAAGILVYNNAGDEIVNMAGTEGATGFVGFVGQSYGDQIAAQLAAGRPVTAVFTSDPIEGDNPSSLTPSTFTSWGPTPDLEFKPDIAGIGGNVYSTLNGNTYGSMSGTSMAAPQLAGIVALGIQEYQDRFAGTNDVDLNTLFRTALVNTAQILTDPDGVPYAPRQIGAGLAQTKDALDTDVFATVDGQAHVALKQVTGPRTVTVTLENRGDQDLSFTTGAQAVTEAWNDAYEVVTETASDAVSAAAPSITVPAGGTTTASFSITPDADADDHYLEGWLDFDSATADQDGGQPDLHVPFLGYVGDWNAENIVDPYAFSDEAVFPQLFGDTSLGTQLATVSGDSTYYLGDGGWISPNGDGASDVVYPLLALMRNAQSIDYAVLDADGTVLARPGLSSEVPAPPLADILTDSSSPFHDATEAMFDGTLWNAQAATEQTLPDGRYTYRVRAGIANGFAPQTPVDMPFGVDTTAPTIQLTGTSPGEDDTVVLTYAFADASGAQDGSSAGWGGVLALVGDDYRTPATVASTPANGATSGTFTVSVPADAPSVLVAAADAAENYSDFDVQTLPAALVLPDQTSLTGGPINDTSVGADRQPLVSEGQLRLRTRTSGPVTSVSVNGGTPVAVDAQTGLATPTASIAEGTSSYTLQGVDAAGQRVGDPRTVTVTYDVTAPVVTVDRAEAAADGTVTVTGSVSDNLATAPTVIVNGRSSAVAADGTFSVTLDAVAQTRRTVTITASDGVNLAPAQVERIETPAADGGFVVSANVDPATEIVRAVTTGDPDLTHAEDGSAQFHVHGELAGQPQEFTIAGQPVTVHPDGTFDAFIALTPGLTDTNFRLLDADGALVWDYAIKFLYDENAPALTLDSADPGQVFEDTSTDSSTLSIYVPTADPSADLTLAGTILDETADYSLTVNNDAVANFQTLLTDLGTAGEWTWTGTVRDHDTIRLITSDQLGNSRTLLITVHFDTSAPDVSITGVSTGDVITQGTSTPVTVTTTDPEATLEATLNDTALDTTTGEAGTTASVDAGALEPGTYSVSGVATDRAGNQSTAARTFTVNAVPVIEGPDTLTLDPDTDLPFDPATYWTVTDDQDDTGLAADTTTLALGANTVVLTATDRYGATATRTVTVTLERPITTLTSGCVSMDAAFVAGDSLTATCTTSGNETTVELSNAQATVSGTISITTKLDVQAVDRVDADGHRLPVTGYTFADGAVTFTGDSDATYVLVGRATGGIPGGSEGPGTPVPAGAVGSGHLTSTGASTGPILWLAGLALVAGAAGLAVAAWRRHRSGGPRP